MLPVALAQAIINHARLGYPHEVCGLIARGPGLDLQIFAGRNVAATPRTAFELDPETLIRQIAFEEEGLALAAIYHSHPDGPAIPSPADMALRDYPAVLHLICSLVRPLHPELRAFRIVDGVALEVRLHQVFDR